MSNFSKAEPVHTLIKTRKKMVINKDYIIEIELGSDKRASNWL